MYVSLLHATRTDLERRKGDSVAMDVMSGNMSELGARQILLLLLLLLCLIASPPYHFCMALGGSSTRKHLQNGFHVETEPSVRHGRHIPILKMLKRQISNFVEGHKLPSITLVFRSTEPVDVRWFRWASYDTMEDSEVPKMLPIHDDVTYNISSLSSGELTATTLTLPGFLEAADNKFETIISTTDGTMQYQILTEIKSSTQYSLEDVDSPEWLTIPSQRYEFYSGQHLRMQCKIFVPYEHPVHVNLLRMSRVVFSETTGFPSKFNIGFEPVVTMHRETQNHAEENGPTIVQGLRKRYRRGHSVYELRFRTTNATKNYEGFYLCAFEREYDKMYAKSQITLIGNPSPFPSFPIVEMLPCNRTDLIPGHRLLVLKKGVETCLRCRAIGYPTPYVALYKKDREVRPSSHTRVRKYVNVADVGVAEATYSFRSPNYGQGLPGEYSCKAYNNRGSKRETFKIRL